MIRSTLQMPTRFLATLVLLALFSVAANAQNIERVFSVSSGGKLELDIETGGDIEISSWDKNEIKVLAEVSGRDAEMIVVDMEETSNGLEIYTEYSRRRARADVDMVIFVPAQFNLEISTSGGDVQIDGIEGKIEGSSMGGDLTFTRLAGTIEFSTMGGDIELSNSDVDGSVHTMGGDVDISDVTGSVDGTTMGGDVTYDNVQSGSGAKKEVNISTMGGDVNVDEALFGADLHTMGGDIEVNRAAKYVKASTMGGDIEIAEINGWIEANTMGGDVEVTMIGGTNGDRHVDIESMGGDILLTIPKGLSMDVDIEITLTRDADDDEYEIDSDFDINVTTKRSNSERRWRSGGEIVGEGKVSGGKNKVVIRTTNGSVTLREGR